MKTTIAPLALTAMFITACTAAGSPSPAPIVTAAPTLTAAPTVTAAPIVTAAPTVTATASAPPTPAPSAAPTSTAPVCSALPGEIAVTVTARANIFGAGHASAPAPGAGGAGVLPPILALPAGTTVVTFPCVTGRVSCCFGESQSNASGTTDFSTNIKSYDGISGIVHGERSVFLVGVFLGDAEPANPAPERLDFTQTCPDVCTVDLFEPEIGQTFFIGVGGESPEYVAPDGATRLFLGFADGYFTQGDPGWYDNNSGQLDIVVRLP